MHKRLFAMATTLMVAGTLLQPVGAIAADQESQSIVWPMQPGESLRDLAALFYPRDKAMQQRLITSVIYLNGEALAGRAADQPFDGGEEILLPDPRALSRYGKSVQKHKPAAADTALPELEATGSGKPATAVHAAQYDSLKQRNQAREQDLEALKQRLRSLEAESAKMQQQIEQNKAALPK